MLTLPISTGVKGVRVPAGSFSGINVEDEIALETPINIYVNDNHFVTLFATPHDLKELGVGHLIAEGIISGLDEIKSIATDGTDVLIATKADVNSKLEQQKHIKVIYSSCGSIDDYFKILDKINKPRVKSDYKITAEKMLDALRGLGKESGSFKMSIAVHSAAIYADGTKKVQMEDVSRHTTVDKAIGKAVFEGLDFNKSILVTTGRQASDMILKAARVGIPITVSLRGPLYSGIYSAMKTGVTMASVTRGKGLTVYTHPDRIIFEEKHHAKSTEMETTERAEAF